MDDLNSHITQVMTLVQEMFRQEIFSPDTFGANSSTDVWIPQPNRSIELQQYTKRPTFRFAVQSIKEDRTVLYGCTIYVDEAQIVDRSIQQLADDLMHSARVALRSFITRDITVTANTLYPVVSLLRYDQWVSK